MSDIKLRKDNVVKSVDSEDNAKALEAKGFVRTDGKTMKATASSEEVKTLKAELMEASKAMEIASKRRGELEKELSETKELLQKAEDKVRTLEVELAGTKEQLEAAVKKNKAVDKK